MNPYQFTVTCDRCGGEGVGTIRTAGAAWDARSFIAHTDRRVCDDILAATRQRELEERDWTVWMKRVVERERGLARRRLAKLVKDTRQELGLV